MAKIRKDLDGIVVVAGSAGEPIILRAGDEVPAGIEVGDHVLAKSKPDSSSGTKSGSKGAKSKSPEKSTGGSKPATSDSALTPPPLVGAGSGTDAWRDYATKATAAAGLQLEIAPDAKRADIVEALNGAGIVTG